MVFFKTFYDDAIFTVRELKVKHPVCLFSVQTGHRKCEIFCSLQPSSCIPCKSACFVTCYRCWRVLRSWTTACCWVCTSWTRARERGVSQARQGETEGDLWVRGCFTRLPWNPSRETARLPKPSPQMTRELAQLGENTHIIHTYLGIHTLPLSVS